MNSEFIIEPREKLWKKRTFKVIIKEDNFIVERPCDIPEFNLEEGLQKLLRRKKKWE